MTLTVANINVTKSQHAIDFVFLTVDQDSKVSVQFGYCSCSNF